ncbi:MAG TPA: hypothetical protein VFZ38_19345 [Vicinamibacterales bacterium]
MNLNPVAQSMKNLGIKAEEVGSQSLFCYSTPSALALTVSGGATPSATSVIQIQADSFFELQRLSGLVFVTGTPNTAITFPPVLLQIADTASGANLFDTAVPLGAVAYLGAGFGPFPVQSPRFFAPNSTVTLTLTNLSDTAAYTVRVNLQGRKLFRK